MKRRPGRRQQKRPVEISTGRLVSCAVSGQLSLFARTSPVTARLGEAVIKEAVKVGAARGGGHATRIGSKGRVRQPPKKKKTPGRRALRSLHFASDRLRTMVQVRRVALLLWATAERELAERPEALNYGLLVLHLLPPPVQEKALGVHQVLPRRPAGPPPIRLPFPCRS